MPFEKGQSGNPGGRPKSNFRVLLEAALFSVGKKQKPKTSPMGTSKLISSTAVVFPYRLTKSFTLIACSIFSSLSSSVLPVCVEMFVWFKGNGHNLYRHRFLVQVAYLYPWTLYACTVFRKAAGSIMGLTGWENRNEKEHGCHTDFDKTGSALP